MAAFLGIILVWGIYWIYYLSTI